MKRILAMCMCLLILLSLTAVTAFPAAADLPGRILTELPLKNSLTKTLSGDGYLIQGSRTFTDLNLSGYALSDLAVEIDFYLEGDLTAFKRNMNAFVEVTSSKKADVQEINWNLANQDWVTDQWFRMQLKFSDAQKGSTDDINLSAVNYSRIFLYVPGGNGKEYTFKYCNYRIVDLSKGAVGTDPVGDGSIRVKDPQWKIVETQFPTTETVIAAYNLGDYMAPDTGADATVALQSLLDAAGAGLSNGEIRTGGGTVFVPAGRYTFRGTLMIPYGVTLQGDWIAPDEEHPEARGTIFEVYSGKGNSDTSNSFITLLPNSEVQGITFWYPEQDPEHIVAYPPTVIMFKNGNWGADYTHVRNCTFINSYRAVQQGPAGSGCPNAYNLYGTPLNTGVYFDNLGDVGRCDYIYFSPSYWENCGLPGAPATRSARTALEKYLYANATALLMGRVDWSYWCFSEFRGYKYGVHFIECVPDPGAYANGHLYGIRFYNCDTAVMVDGISTGAAEVFSNLYIENCKIGIHTVPIQTQMGNLNMNGCVINADTAILHEGNMEFFINGFVFERGGVVASRGPLVISGSEFRFAGDHVTLENGVTSVILQDNGCTAGEFTVKNPALCPVQISSKPVPRPEINWLEPEQAQDRTVRAARQVLYVADFDKTGKNDITTALQNLLTKAGNEGGGYVFLPPGHYRLNGSVTVPSGVELTGSVDIGRNPVQMGTILDVYGTQRKATVILSADSGIRGICVDYPEQGLTVSNFKANYPYFVEGAGENVYIVNLAIRNGVKGIDLATNKCDNHYVKYLAGYTFLNAIKVGGGSVGGSIINYQMNYSSWWNGLESKFGSWKNSPSSSQMSSPNGGAWQLNNIYAQQNGVILQVGDVTDQVIYDNFSYAGGVGVYFVEENGRGASGWNVGNAYDYTAVGIKVDAIGDMPIINPQIVSFNHTDRDLSGSPHIDTYHMYLTDKCKDDVVILNVACWAQPDAYYRVDGGSLTLFCGTYTDGAKQDCVAILGENGKLYLQNGAVTNNGINNFVKGVPANLTVSGYINSKSRGGEQNADWGINMVRLGRWDVPKNARIDDSRRMILTEAFTDYSVTEQNGVGNVLARGGTFTSLSTAGTDTSVQRVSVEGNDMMYMSHTRNAVTAYVRHNATRLTGGRINDEYMLETRMSVASLRDSQDASMSLTVYCISDGTAKESVNLAEFRRDGFYAAGTKLADYQPNTFYRVQVEMDLRDASRKSYTVSLLKDDYTLIRKSDAVLFPEIYQAADSEVGSLSYVAYAESGSGSASTGVFVDYLFINQDPTVIPAVALGDVDGDGGITSTDARMTLQLAVDKIKETDVPNPAAMDVDGDGSVTSTDARLILQKSVGKIDAFPAA